MDDISLEKARFSCLYCCCWMLCSYLQKSLLRGCSEFKSLDFHLKKIGVLMFLLNSVVYEELVRINRYRD